MRKMFTSAILCAALSLTFTACLDEEKDNAKSDMPEQGSTFCSAEMPEDFTPDGRTSGATQKNTQWTKGQTIRIKFLNGSATLQNKVRTFATAWLTHANLKFQWVASSQTSDIKILFSADGYWSTLGIQCRNVAQRQPSMNLAFTSATSDATIKEVTLHEFGHALGMIHEHQNPAVNISWNKEVVYAELGGPPNNWTRAQVDHNLFNPQAASQTNFSAYDRLSIMHYQIPARWTTNGFSVGANTDLSSTDKSFIASIYPF
jgi:hypothetical protein